MTRGPARDVIVIGAGFGGLAAALSLAERGARVVLCESLKYPGGCASTFTRRGVSFEAGATLFSGLAEDQLFGKWIRAHSMPVAIDWLDPVVELRTPDLALCVPPRREDLIAALAALPNAPVPELHAFFERQSKVAGALWRLFDDPSLLPPFTVSALRRHALSAPRYLALLPLLGRSLADVLRAHGLEAFSPLRAYLDAVCQITVQCGAAEAEAPFAMAAMDYYFRGTGHIRGGIGALAGGLADAFKRAGGEVLFANAVRAVHCEGDLFRVEARKGELLARAVVANVLPHGARLLLGLREGERPELDDLAAEVERGWGAAMLYLVARPPEGARPSAQHIEMIDDPEAPFIEGNHLFASVSGEDDEGRAPPGHRTITVSTHIPLQKLRAMPEAEQAAYIAAVQDRMKSVFERRAPEWWSGVTRVETASPRTFERFTGRFGGYVGGVPRRAGLANYRRLGPFAVVPGFYLVGDSVFPGQSTLAVAIGGVRAAEQIARDLR
jgi:phytoene dehydrogenase-like protein